MKVVYFDCWGGASGDMILGALLDAGASVDRLNTGLEALGLGLRVEAERVRRAGLAAVRARVLCGEAAADHVDPGHHHPHRGLREVRRLVAVPGLGGNIVALAMSVFERLALAEAAVHGVQPDDVHFHEVGAMDAIGDVVGTCLCLADLDIREVLFSPLPTGGGSVRSAHGELPVPAPATLRLLHGLEVYDPGVPHEMVTPTGAALLTALGRQSRHWPAMTILASGTGAGGRDTARPNVIRAVVGETAAGGAGGAAPGWSAESVFLVETNLDDASGQVLGAAVERLLGGGALDAWWSSCGMKKGRPGVQVQCLVRGTELERVAALLFAELPTLGIRMHEVVRYVLRREVVAVTTPWGTVRVKVGRVGDAISTVSPEYEDCRGLADGAGVPVRAVLAAAADAAAAAGLRPTPQSGAATVPSPP